MLTCLVNYSEITRVARVSFSLIPRISRAKPMRCVGWGSTLEAFCRVEEVYRLLFQNWKLKFYWDILSSG